MNNDQVNELWESARELLANREETSSTMALSYLTFLVPRNVNDTQIVFSTRLLYAKQQIESRYMQFISDAYFVLLGNKRDILIEIDEDSEFTPVDTPGEASFLTNKKANTAAVGATVGAVTPPPATAVNAVVAPPLSYTQNFAAVNVDNAETTTATGISAIFSQDTLTSAAPDPEQGLKTFSNFVVGSSNNFAYGAAMRVAENPGQINPLFIYGRSGLGKTHLQLAIKNYVTQYNPLKTVVYAPTSEFVNDFTSAIANDRNLTDFKRKYYTCDILLLDDVQHLEGKGGTTDALFDIFNVFIEQKKQIVLSADRSPTEINLDERFTSRFAQGITVDIQPPSYEMKAAIFINYKNFFCNQINVSDVFIPEEVVQYIIELSGSNIREFEGAIASVVFNIVSRPPESRNIPITVEEAKAIVGKAFTHKETNRVDIPVIQQAVESYYSVSHQDLLSDKRSKNISHPRQVAMYLARQLTTKSFPEIGKSFGNKDHTSAMYACRNIQAKVLANVGIKGEVERLKELITS